MKRQIASIAALLASALGVSATTLYVAPNGNDAWTGRSPAVNESKTDGPLASLIGARNAIRKQTDRSQPITVSIADGRYALLEPLLLEPQDSGTFDAPITYAAASEAKPVFSGGVPVRGWRVTSQGLWEAKLPAGLATEQLWVNGLRATPARHLGGETILIRKVAETLTGKARAQPSVLVKFKSASARQTISVEPSKLTGLEQLSSEEVREARVMVFHNWNASPRRVGSINVATGEISVEGGAMQEWSSWNAKGSTLWIDNVRTGLNVPGSWTIDRVGTILYRPRAGESLTTAEAVVAAADKLVLLQGSPGEGNYVENLNFVGLSFAHTRWVLPTRGIGAEDGLDDLQAAAHIDAVIMGDGIRRVGFERCDISHVSRQALWFRRGCRDIRIERCTFSDLGAGAVRVGDYVAPRYPFESTGGVIVRNCRISQGGRVFPSATGIVVMQGEANLIAHNEIDDFYYSGISVGWAWGYLPTSARDNIVEFNRVSKIGQKLLSDMAGIYFLGPGERNVCRNNVVTDVTCQAYGGWGIYADEGSTGVVYENNLIVGTHSGGFHQNYGKGNVVQNNIFVGGKDMQVTRPRPEEHLSFTFERNIVVWSQGPLAGGRSFENSGKVAFEKNLFHATGLAAGAFEKELAERRAQGLDTTSMAADPLFVDPTSGNFHLRPESPAAKIGFVPFDYTQAGIQPQ